ncbi:uncharacterized protein BX663DRAFT_519253 [Cokeromyces recurvatus]|uniref:uncharacterized protein n=1 Tax=Cokeromyces recurvatus TaxID=90255 RepID=UPI00221F5019|nr:uncharacterized protein BX663DRAFT_519253 [Cokeromyces recurvatus]KAI7899998.1 hypothetical protein BX663DRAFT_519253 [Cokeromyces recurvatus]
MCIDNYKCLLLLRIQFHFYSNKVKRREQHSAISHLLSLGIYDDRLFEFNYPFHNKRLLRYRILPLFKVSFSGFVLTTNASITDTLPLCLLLPYISSLRPLIIRFSFLIYNIELA